MDGLSAAQVCASCGRCYGTGSGTNASQLYTCPATNATAIGRYRRLTSYGGNGGPVWSEQCICGRPGIRYCWEIGTAGWILMAIPIIVCLGCVLVIQCETDCQCAPVQSVGCVICFLLIAGLSIGITFDGHPNGGPGTGDAIEDDDIDDDFDGAGDDDDFDPGILTKSTIQFTVLGVSAFVLLVLQTCARGWRPGRLPMLVEIIAFFSMLE